MTKSEEDTQKEIELAIDNTKQFHNYMKIGPYDYLPLKTDFATLEAVEDERKLIIFRLWEWRKDNLEYFTSGEVCGINHVINMFIAGKI